MADNEPALERWYYDFNRKAFVLIMNHGRNWVFRHIKGVMERCTIKVLQQVLQSDIPRGSLCQRTEKLFRFIRRKVLNEQVDNQKRVKWWKFLQTENLNVEVTYTNGDSEMFEADYISDVSPRSFVEELIEKPMVNSTDDVDALNFQNLLRGIVASWLETPVSDDEFSEDERPVIEVIEDETYSDGSDGYSSEPWFTGLD